MLSVLSSSLLWFFGQYPLGGVMGEVVQSANKQNRYDIKATADANTPRWGCLSSRKGIIIFFEARFESFPAHQCWWSEGPSELHLAEGKAPAASITPGVVAMVSVNNSWCTGVKVKRSLQSFVFGSGTLKKHYGKYFTTTLVSLALCLHWGFFRQ